MQRIFGKFLLCLSILAGTAELTACGGSTTTPSSDVLDAAATDSTDDASPLSDTVSPTDSSSSDTTDAAIDATPTDIQAICLEGVPNPLQFDATHVGSGAMATLNVHNCGLQPICVTGVELQNQSAYLGEYALSMQAMATACPGVDPTKGPSVTAPCCVTSGSQVGVDVYFTPLYKSSAPKTAQVWVHYNNTKVIVLLSGMATAAP